MNNDFRANDHAWIRELLDYPRNLEADLDYFQDTAEIELPDDPIERVIFQDRAKAAIRSIAHNRGHILMVGRPGTGKSMLAGMFNEVVERAVGDLLRPRRAIVAYPGKDRNHIRFAYERPETIEAHIQEVMDAVETARDNSGRFSLDEQIGALRRVRIGLTWAAVVSVVAGVFFPPAFALTGLAGMGAIFLFIQENNHQAQEKIQREAAASGNNPVKPLYDMVPEVLYDPRNDKSLMARVSEPNARNMKGGFRHDPYQSGNLHTPAHKRAYLGAHATAPIIYIDELKTLVRDGYMAELLEIMQNKSYVLEGGRAAGSGSADKSENALKADNIIIACCNHDTLAYLQQEGDGAFLSRIEDRGEIVQLDSAVAETPAVLRQVAQYVAQEVVNLESAFAEAWGEVMASEGREGVRRRSEPIFGRALPEDFELKARPFSRSAVMEIVKELRCRAADGKLSGILRPINGIIKAAEFEAILDNSARVTPEHVRRGLGAHLSLEGALSKDLIAHKKDLKKFIDSLTDEIGYVVGLAVIESRSSGQMYGQPLPIHCQVDAGGVDRVVAPGKIGDIAKAAAQNVRASIRRVLKKIGAPYLGYEMHVEYIQAHGGVEGDSASVAMDVGLVSDFIRQPVNQKIGVTGSLTGDIVLAVGGVTEKVRSIMDPDLGMEGACIPWQNKHDIEPLLVNAEAECFDCDGIPAIRIYRQADRCLPFEIFFCKTKYNVYRIMMGLDREAVEERMARRSRLDLEAHLNRSRQPEPDDGGQRPAAEAAAVQAQP